MGVSYSADSDNALAPSRITGGMAQPHYKTAGGQTHGLSIDAISEALHAYGFERNVAIPGRALRAPSGSPPVARTIGTHTIERRRASDRLEINSRDPNARIIFDESPSSSAEQGYTFETHDHHWSRSTPMASP